MTDVLKLKLKCTCTGRGACGYLPCGFLQRGNQIYTRLNTLTLFHWFSNGELSSRFVRSLVSGEWNSLEREGAWMDRSLLLQRCWRKDRKWRSERRTRNAFSPLVLAFCLEAVGLSWHLYLYTLRHDGLSDRPCSCCSRPGGDFSLSDSGWILVLLSPPSTAATCWRR